MRKEPGKLATLAVSRADQRGCTGKGNCRTSIHCLHRGMWGRSDNENTIFTLFQGLLWKWENDS